MYIYIYIHTHIYVHTYTHTHTHTHTHTETTHIGQTKASFPDEASLFFLSFRRCAQMFALTAPFFDLSSALACQSIVSVDKSRLQSASLKRETTQVILTQYMTFYVFAHLYACKQTCTRARALSLFPLSAIHIISSARALSLCISIVIGDLICLFPLIVLLAVSLPSGLELFVWRITYDLFYAVKAS